MATAVNKAALTAPVEVSRPLRIVTATSLFDGHDASINVMRRIMQELGGEVIHLGHNRSVVEVVQAAVQEDAAAIAVSSYQGGHVEYFRYMIDLLKEKDCAHIRVFAGGGGVIVPQEVAALEAYGVEKIYTPEDGRVMGLLGMVRDLLERTARSQYVIEDAPAVALEDDRGVGRLLTAVEELKEADSSAHTTLMKTVEARVAGKTPVLGVTGTGGAGKSSLVDELITRFMNDFPEKRVAVISIDPTRRRTGGALLGDRIRMNGVVNSQVFMRSLATRAKHGDISEALGESITVLKAAGYDLIIAETAGIGQGDAGIVPFVDLAMYVMTAEFGAASQLEKIDMIDFADLVVINKYDRAGSEDALRDVRKQFQRNHGAFNETPEEMPVFGTVAARFNDDGVTALYHGLLHLIRGRFDVDWSSSLPQPLHKFASANSVVIPPERVRYLSDISDCVRRYHDEGAAQAALVRKIWQLDGILHDVVEDSVKTSLLNRKTELMRQVSKDSFQLLEDFKTLETAYSGVTYSYTVRDREIQVPLTRESLAGSRIRRVALPKYVDPGQRLQWLLRENVPGSFPFTGGVFPFRRSDEDPARMFAGEGDAKRTNARFKYLSKDSDAKRLSTAFDSVTLYGRDPDPRPDIYGKIGTSGVSVATLDDMKQLYAGFDLWAPNTSVSMTINGPAPIILAMFFNTAIDQRVADLEAKEGRTATREEREHFHREVLSQVRGTLQADILKEDQGQNTCIFAIDFALKMQGDIQEYFIQEGVRNFYSISISGYHIAEAGANPISQLAFTLANGFTFVEYFLARGMDINRFAENLSFFFSCGMDPEYAVLNRVARRIWAVALRERYGAEERAQKLKTHIQTSGRSLHAQEVDFNDIRTTLQALTALYDRCNSLHTNAFDEAVTTPTEGSVRRAMAIQLIINKEHGLAMNENPLQGSFIIEELTDLVETAVLEEFDRISERGGVLGAMERGYQRGKIQDDSHHYEHLKSNGAYPIVGVNTFVDPHGDHAEMMANMEVRRGTEEEKSAQVEQVKAFHEKHADRSDAALERLKQVCRNNGNIFEELMDTVRYCSLGQITQALFEIGGEYRRNT